MEITREITIEDLVRVKPAAVRYLSEKGIKCIACGEPVWGTLEEAAREKGFGNAEIETFLRDLNTFKP
jgi:methionine synthase II (cobalamin-independent)